MKTEVQIGEVVEVNPKIPEILLRKNSGVVSFVPMAGVTENGVLAFSEEKNLVDVRKGYTYFKRGDLLIAKITPCFENGKAVLVNNLPHPVGFGSTEFHVLRPSTDIDPKYLFYFIHNPAFRFTGQRHMTGTAGQKRLPVDFLKRYTIPLPSVSEQKRIAAILDKADAIRRKRGQAIQLADEFLRSVFLDMFGDPVTNPKGYNSSPLGDLVEIISGGTPSRAEKRFWNGMFPWVSPKDMKSITISNSIEKISEDVFSETSLKRLPKKSILIVIRGMILVHTIPIAITEEEVAINKDIKALKTRSSLLPEFLLWSLLVQHNFILSKVSTAAHGTKRLDTADLQQIKIPLPSIELQNRFIEIVCKFSKIDHQTSFSLKEAENLFYSLVQKAFNGEL